MRQLGISMEELGRQQREDRTLSYAIRRTGGRPMREGFRSGASYDIKDGLVYGRFWSEGKCRRQLMLPIQHRRGLTDVNGHINRRHDISTNENGPLAGNTLGCTKFWE